jgi:YHS domain-containing protein
MEWRMELVKDPVCGMEIDESQVNDKSKVGESVYYFCCPNCKARFDKNPDKFARG